VSELPRSRSGYDAILNVVDSVSKHRHFIPTFTTATAEQTAELFFRKVWHHHGLPDAVISDRGPQFVVAFTRELYCLLGIKLSTTTAYHPQSDGQTEWVNQEMEQFLRSFVNEMQND
jgi:transposase InsO family protein